MKKTVLGIIVTCFGAALSETINYLMMKEEVKKEVKAQTEAQKED